MRPCTSRTKVWIAVAAVVVALAPGVMRLALVSGAHRSLAQEFKARHEYNNYMATAVRTGAAALRNSLYDRAHRKDGRLYARYKQLAEHYFALAEKYERAARRPWASISPDPPPPTVPEPAGCE